MARPLFQTLFGVQAVSKTRYPAFILTGLRGIPNGSYDAAGVLEFQHNTSSFTTGFLARSWAHKVHTRRNPIHAHMEIGEFGVGRPDFGGRWPRGEALGKKKAVRSTKSQPRLSGVSVLLHCIGAGDDKLGVSRARYAI